MVRIRTRKIPSTIRNTVWNYYIGPDIKMDNCYCCKFEPITFANFECGHVIAYSKGGETNIKNLRPICSNCNKSMGSTCMTKFMEHYGLDEIKNNHCYKENKNETINSIIAKIKELNGYKKFQLYSIMASIDDIYESNEKYQEIAEKNPELYGNILFENKYELYGHEIIELFENKRINFSLDYDEQTNDNETIIVDEISKENIYDYKLYIVLKKCKILNIFNKKE